MPTIRLSRKDNDILSRREWHLLFNANPVSASTAVGAAVSGGATRLMPRHHVHPQIATSQVVTSTFASQDAGLYSRGHEHDLNGGQDLPTQIPLKFSWDTFLIKTYFSEVEKSYLVLLTNLKQCWFEKLNLWDIRERSKRIKSFAYDEDSQIEALILSLSTIFTEEQEKDKDAFSIAQRRLDKKPGNAYNMNNAMTTGGHLFENESGTKANGSNVLHSVTTTKRRRLFLEDSDDDTPLKDPHQPIDENSPEDSTDDENDNGDDSDSEDDIDRQGIGAVNTFIQEGLTSIQESQERSQRRRRRRRRAIDGPTALFDHLVSPLISVTNAYKKQVRMLEAIIKSKENEVFEALEIMEQSGVNHHNRRRVTQPYQKGDMETKLQSVSSGGSFDGWW
ncbi:hypothetical protein BGW38_000644 [Lunasporangiospora selenospora]|uniref:XLF-like N-terminal domain-containing protein n=1 Tax=Lunasporangiospora selenospora TaxID=979761 RepID=A0A9P6KE17_9FUNG|nr:hypothetical protein BGW38_000644 [Lunasporangiospora selenospora]